MKRNSFFPAVIIMIMAVMSASAQLTFNHAFLLGNTFNDRGTEVVADAAGNYYCAGYYNYWININPLGVPLYLTSNGGEDFYVAKYSPSGGMLWSVSAGGLQDDEVMSIALDNNNNVYVTGRFSGTVDFDPGASTDSHTSNGGADIFLLKLNNNGGYVWSITLGGTSDDQGNSIAFGSSFNSVTLCGTFNSAAVDFDPGAGTQIINSSSFSKGFLASYDAGNGSYQWAFEFGGSGTAHVSQLCNDASGDLYVTGDYSGTNIDFDPGTGTALFTSAGSIDIFIAKYNSAGIYQWSHSLGSSGGDLGASITCDNNGYVYAGGYFNSATVDFDPGGGTVNLSTNGVQDLYLTKYSSSGIFQWAFSIGGTNSEVTQDITTDAAGNVFITGSWGDVVDFDPGGGIFTLTGASTSDAFLAQYNANGNFIDAISFGGTGYEFGIGVTVIPSGKVAVTGFFSTDSIDFNPGAGSSFLANTGGNTTWVDAFVAVYQYTATGISDQHPAGNVKLYPVPATDILHLENYSGISADKIEIIDARGRIVLSLPYTSNIAVGNLQPGIYTMRMVADAFIYHTQFIKE